MPEEGDLVLCTISKIQPHCAWASLDEYENLKGMIHISEIASSWVRNIRNFIRDGQHIVCRVLSSDTKTKHISLSIKRVTDGEKRNKMESARKERRAEKMLEFVAKKNGTTFEKAYEEVGKKFEEEYGDIWSGFEAAARGEKLPISTKWSKVITEIAEKNVTFPVYEISRFINISSPASDGIEVVKKVLVSLTKDGVDVKYISAPKYKVSLKGENRKQTAIKLQKLCQAAIDQISSSGGSGELLK